MTVCPIAVVAGCEKCPALRICPLKTVLGNYQPEAKKGAAGKTRAATPPDGGPKRKK